MKSVQKVGRVAFEIQNQNAKYGCRFITTQNTQMCIVLFEKMFM